MTPYEIRMECLNKALGISYHRTEGDPPLSAEQWVEMAKTFEAYVTGEKVPEVMSAAAVNAGLRALQDAVYTLTSKQPPVA